MASSMAIRCSQPPKLFFSPLFKVRSLQHLNNKTRILPKTLSTSAIPNVYQTTSPPSHSSDQRFYGDELGNPPHHHHHHHQSTSQPGNFILNQRTQNQLYPPPNHYNYPNAVYPNQGCAYPNQEGYPQQHQHQYQTPNPWNQNYPQQDNQWNKNYSQHQNPPQVRPNVRGDYGHPGSPNRWDNRIRDTHNRETLISGPHVWVRPIDDRIWMLMLVLMLMLMFQLRLRLRLRLFRFMTWRVCVKWVRLTKL